MSDHDFSIPIPQSTTNHALLFGTLPQIPTVLGFALVILSILAARSMFVTVSAVTLYALFIYALYALSKHDAWLIEKLIDAINYRSYYPAHSSIDYKRKGSIKW